MATLQTQERFEKLYEEVKSELKGVLPLSEHVNSLPNYFKSINTLGRCNRKIIAGKIKIFTISLNEYLENCTDQTIKNTIAHELIHTIDGCFDHKNKFKAMAQRIAHLGYTVSRTSKCKEFGEFVNKLRQDRETRRKSKIYKVTCNHCGRSVLRQRRINVNHYICPVCHGSLRLEEV